MLSRFFHQLEVGVTQLRPEVSLKYDRVKKGVPATAGTMHTDSLVAGVPGRLAVKGNKDGPSYVVEAPARLD